MKKYLAILLLPLLAACSSNGPKEAIVSGKLLNFKDTVVYLSVKGITETVKLNADKSFTYKTTIDKPLLYNLKGGRRTNIEFYLNPGDITELTVDIDNPKDGTKFTGKLEPVNSYLVEKKKITNDYISNFSDFFGLEKESFYGKLDSLKNELLDKAKSISNKRIAAQEIASIEYFVKGLKVNYPEYNAYVNKVEFNADSADYSILNGIDMNNAYHLMFTDYSDLVNKVIMSKFIKENGAKALETMPASERITKIFALIDANVTNQEVKDFLKHNAFIEDLSYGQFWTLSDLVNKFLTECQTPGYKSIIEKLYNQKMLIAPGKTAPTFKYKDINGKEYALEDFKGTLVYIDFWATWCSPCRQELPFLEGVENAYHGKKITFISMSVDEVANNWERMVKEKKMKGIQLHAEGAWTSSVAKDYQIKGIPTFVLIDQNGLIISPSAPRPSTGDELKKLLDENLAKIK